MAYDLGILVMMATAIAGILYAERETAKKGVRYIGQTRVPDTPVEHRNHPRTEIEAPVPYLGAAETDSSRADPTSVSEMALHIAAAKTRAFIHAREMHTTEKYLARMDSIKKEGGGFTWRTTDPREAVIRREKNETADPFDLWYRRAQRETLFRALSYLRESERLIVVLYYEQELTMKQIADRLGLDESTVSQRYYVALAHLRASVEPVLRPRHLTSDDITKSMSMTSENLEHYDRTFDALEQRVRRLEEQAAQRRESATEAERESDEERLNFIN
jgi:RNA polymerase sigma factor (sigma-70 family)